MAEATKGLKTLRDFVRWGASRFEAAGLHYGHGTDNALDEALLLVLDTLHLDHGLPEPFLDARLTKPERARVAAVLGRRIDERIPAAYLTGTARFCGLDFEVTRDTLVPRSPIAELIEAGFAPWIGSERVARVLDLCTGSGCIGIACAFAFPDAEVDLSDISPAALAVARRNIARHRLDGRVRALEADLFDGLEGRYDLIVGNPPYVDADEMAALAPEFRHEPVLGLAGGADGLDLVVRLLQAAPDHLEPGGILVVEVGNSAAALAGRFPRVPFLWLEFERGGDGVFLLTLEQLLAHRDEFEQEVAA